jgi:hypothetical protein
MLYSVELRGHSQKSNAFANGFGDQRGGKNKGKSDSGKILPAI